MTPHLLRKMTVADVDQVLQIDRQSFAVSWSEVTFLHEMNENPNAYMGVVLKSQPVVEENSGFSLLRRLRQPKQETVVAAYAGMWIHGREAHISTIASHPNFRRQGFGELMLIGMIGRSIALGADHVVLEVRMSNLSAQTLYRKYEFAATGFYPRYYHDNQEDALYMVVRPLDEAYLERLRGRVALLAARTPFTDEFSGLHLEQAISTSSKE